MQSYLEHHGVKGQRWGVRRYQKRDGTLTKLGRQRYRELASDYVQRNPEQYRYKRDQVHDNLSKAGIVKQNSNTDVIKKGSKLQRVANDIEVLDDKSRYMTITKNDNDNYASHWEHFVDMGRWDGEAVINNYRATRDLKVATGEKVVNDLVEKYGNRKIKELYSDLKLTNLETLKIRDRQEDKWARDYSWKAEEKVNKFLTKTMRRKLSDIIKDYKNNTDYDAIVDVEDYINEFGEYPLIVLNPKKSVALKK